MAIRSITSPEDQTVTFVELFFDLVFVFSVTQLVGLLHHDLSWPGVGQAVLVFWLVWWAWTQFTWTLNAADTTHLTRASRCRCRSVSAWRWRCVAAWRS